jgi:hypothetical protein
MAAAVQILGLTERIMGFRVKKYSIDVGIYQTATEKKQRAID